METSKLAPLQVYILTEDTSRINKTYLKIFTTEAGFAEPIFTGIQYPDEKWIRRFCNYMCRSEMIELYNHYIIWMKAIKTNQPQVILYNDSYTTQPNLIISELIKAGSLLHNEDIVFYGKYLDRCDKYKFNRTVAISNNSTVTKFSLYRTFSAYGIYAYLITPSGAATLINELTYNPVPAEMLVHDLLEKDLLKGVTYHPSIIRLPKSEQECRSPDDLCLNWGMWFWYIIIFICLGIIIGLIIYFTAEKFVYKPCNEISSGFERIDPNLVPVSCPCK